jgi:hypothetical protein
MITRSDRTSPCSAQIRGDEPVQLRFDSPDDDLAQRIVGALRQSRRFDAWPAALLCSSIMMRSAIYIQNIAPRAAGLIEIKEARRSGPVASS